MAIVDEAMNADKKPDRCNESFAILTSLEVFDNLKLRNPSLEEELRICGRGRKPGPEPAPAPTAAVPPARVGPLSEYAPWPARPNGQPQYARGSANHPAASISSPADGSTNHACESDIGPKLHPTAFHFPESLIFLARPRGIEPRFPP